MWLPFVAILLWGALSFWLLDVVIGVIVALAALGNLTARRQARRLAATIADLNARPAGIRARLREQNRTGELTPIAGWRWTGGNLLERDVPESPERYSDRR